MGFLKTLREKLFGPKFPSMDWHLEKVAEVARTPDLHEIEQQKQHFLFVCDDLMTGHRRHHLLDGSKRRAWAFTKAPFSVWKRKAAKDTSVIPFEGPSPLVPNCVIKGEVHFVPTSIIKLLDDHKVNGVQFIRKRVRIVIPHREWYYDEDMKLVHSSREIRQHLSPFMYVAAPDFWNDHWNTDTFNKVNLTAWSWAKGDVHLLEDHQKYYYFKYAEYFEK